MSFFRSLTTDLRERQVLPAVIVLAVLALGIPFYAASELSKSAAPAPVSVPPVNSAPPKGTPAPSSELALVQSTPSQHSTVYKGQERNPFGSSGSGSSNASSSSSGSLSQTSTPQTSTPQTSTPTVTTPVTTTPPPPPSTTPSHQAGPSNTSAPAELDADQVYTVRGVATYGSEQDKLDDIERLTPLPANDSEVVYLGVVKGGKRAAFLLTGSVPAKRSFTGGVKCLPSGSDCEVVELAVGARLELEPTGGHGVSTFTFKLNGIGAEKFHSASAAKHARRNVATAGAQLLAQSTSPTLTAFFYNLGAGALLYEPSRTLGSTGASGSTGSSGTTP